jgi:hypothetical protein
MELLGVTGQRDSPRGTRLPPAKGEGKALFSFKPSRATIPTWDTYILQLHYGADVLGPPWCRMVTVRRKPKGQLC